MSAIAPLAVALAATMATAPARADAGPVAYLVQDAVENTVPAQVADTAHPTVELPASAVRGVLKTGRGLAKVDGSGAKSRLGSGVLRTARGDLSFTGLAAECATGLDGVVSGTMTITRDKTLAGALAGVPAMPPANYRLPGKGQVESIILNKQVRGAAKDLTVTAVSLVDETGAARDYGVARCAPAARRPAPVPAGPAAGLTESLVPTVTGLLTSQLGQMPGASQGGAATPKKPGALPRPAHRAKPGTATDMLPADLTGTVTGLAGGLTGAADPAADPSAAGLLGGAPGLPLVG
ncbi:hypothetical protein [Actinomadura sp. 9N407]|uniref:hypothetical protein n=1 Tax=Actinomadura sp. 9N407 TaxID=3375154 RepID=UPI00378E2C3C